MQRYKSQVNSGVLAYDIGKDRIKIKFLDGTVYLYTNQSAGAYGEVMVSGYNLRDRVGSVYSV